MIRVGTFAIGVGTFVVVTRVGLVSYSILTCFRFKFINPIMRGRNRVQLPDFDW